MFPHSKSSHHEKASHPARETFMFNPYEVAFCGFSHSGKTTVLTRLVPELSREFKIGYVKNDVHSFQMDKEGKDTFKVKQSGADFAFISDPVHFAFVRSGRADPMSHQNIFLDADIVLVEGYKNSQIPKFIFIDEREEILKDIQDQKFKNVIGFIGIKSSYPALPPDVVYFHREDIAGIKRCLLRHFQSRAREIPFYGLLLAGGKSTRMRQDKSLLQYHGKSQLEHGFELLSRICPKVFVSVRQEQADCAGYSHLPQVHDQILNAGPLGGILSAMSAYPQAAWFVLACDLPFLDLKALEHLNQRRNPFKFATVYQSSHEALPEPLCAIYEPKAKFRLNQFFANGIHCPRKILLNSDIRMIPPEEAMSLDNINHPEEYQKAAAVLKRKTETSA